MAPNSATRVTTLSFLLLLAIATCLEAAKTLKQKQTNMVFYVQDWESGPNITTIPIAGIPTKPWGALQFGTVFVIDQDFTEGIDRNSTLVGNVRGIYVNAAKDGSDIHYSVSLVFTNEKYNGSTLEVHGSNRFSNKYREMPIISGTGKFRYAKGYIILETVYVDVPGFNAIIRWNASVLHY